MKASEGLMHVISPGLYSSIQDIGRRGFGEYGIPTSGVMDQVSFEAVNRLLGNKKDTACLEMSMTGGHFRFNTITYIALSGAIAPIHLNGKKQNINTIIKVKEGDELKIGRFSKGARMYLGIAGGFLTEKIMDSRSWFSGITDQDRIKQYDSLKYKRTTNLDFADQENLSVSNDFFEDPVVKVYPGPEFQQLTEEERKQLSNKKFSLSTQQDRMGIHLKQLLKNDLDEILTAPVYTGTVQLTPGGKLIILMQDAQTTGGYPRILQLDEDSIAKIAQKKPGEEIQFKLVED